MAADEMNDDSAGRSFEERPLMEHPWRVLHVIANHEKRVVQHLASRSLEHFLPLYALKSRWSDRTVALERPLFPGYVFTRFAAAERIGVLSTPGVLSLLGGGDLGEVAADEIARIREGLATGQTLRPHPAISKGTRVRVRNGVFEGAEGLVTELRGQCKVILAVRAISQCFSLCVESSDLEVVNDRATQIGHVPTRKLAIHRPS
jgi:transcriptional antiterminator NusG